MRLTSCFGSTQRRLQRQPDVPVFLLPQRLEDLQCHVRVVRVLHIHADEEPVLTGWNQNAPEIINAGRAIDVDAKLRQFQRNVALDARRHDHVDEPDVFLCCRGGFVNRPDALAQVVEREQHPAFLQQAGVADGFFDRLAGDEPPGEAVRGCHAVLRRQRLSALLRDRAKKESLGTAVHEDYTVMQNSEFRMQFTCERRRRQAPARDVKVLSAFCIQNSALMSVARGRFEQVIERPCVIPQHVAIANAQVVRFSATMTPRPSSGFDGAATASGPLVTPRFAPQDASVSMSTDVRSSSSRCVIDGRIAAATSAVGSTLYNRPDRLHDRCGRTRAPSSVSSGSTPSTEIGAPKVTNARDL
jgi:hypothetical protein